MRWSILFLFILVLVVLGICVFIALTQYQARKKGLPAPTWQSYIPFTNDRNTRYRSNNYDNNSGLGSWFQNKWARMRGRGRRQGSYAEPLEGPWDVRMEGSAHASTPYSAHMDEDDDVGFESTSTYYGAHYNSGPPAYPDSYLSSPRETTPTRDSDSVEQSHTLHHSHQKEPHTNPFISEEDDFDATQSESNKHRDTNLEPARNQE